MEWYCEIDFKYNHSDQKLFIESDYTALTTAIPHSWGKMAASISFITGVGLGLIHTKGNSYDPGMLVSIVNAQLPSPNIFL